MKLLIENMTCGGCARGVTAIIHEIDPSAKVDIDLATKVVSVESTESIDKITNALAEDGFPAKSQ
ncbi:heavy-metal-associated domain-containing protein [Acinetobacter radioresistens]|uniref:heavy-metal-associated domain-containing protein n=1 Tax=Acinetobacter radioresistens TaxID=40216 RepID=UPI000C32F6BB|nr:heavy-metal-associated domain-containing protein [Acinetobacter radioresistens]MCM1936204.1 heavy-metal-associated domain-containing protein [Acinetobacter radioresistens]MCM1953850.1 heavy-metal-associated domain-containing protein [Acinetobacter radioresistens]MCU4309888.1 heavy-metal-associated domain-containing protein [Acinetobacter radioresistens]MCU4567557.1 heavy-metal-associated domain-containing protein [Acinetobacter radioresistens]PKH28197.1 heavy metal transporter [Acinetobacte